MPMRSIRSRVAGCGNKNQTASTSGHALDDEEDGVASKPSNVAAKPVEKSPVETPAPIVAKAPAAPRLQRRWPRPSKPPFRPLCRSRSRSSRLPPSPR